MRVQPSFRIAGLSFNGWPGPAVIAGLMIALICCGCCGCNPFGGAS